MPETIRWTVLPDGMAADGSLRLTVLVTPRLTGATTLAAFPGFLDWPATLGRCLAALRLELRPPDATGPGIQLPLTPRTDRFPPADSALWKALFRATSTVSPPPQAPAAPPVLRSFPGRAVHQRTLSLYQDVATATAFRRAFPGSGGGGGQGLSDPQPPPSWDHPDPRDLLHTLTRPLTTFARRVDAAYPRLDPLLTAPPGNPFRPRVMQRSDADYQANQAVFNLAELYRFYDRPPAPSTATAEPAPAELAPAELAPAELDVHTACGLLADYPELLRRFGLAVDLLAAPPPQLSDQWQARATFTTAQDTLNQDETLRPWTRLRYAAGQRFEAYAADDGLHGRRMLRLGGPGILLTDLDMDAAAIKLVEFARTTTDQSPVTGSGTATPALHGAGLTVLLDERETVLADQMEADARRLAGTSAALLDAQHLVRGYRVDVATVDETTGRTADWHPLCARTGRYAVRRPGEAPVPITVAPDEGQVKASALSHDRADDRQLYVHQALFGWHGWSLAAPPPGRTLGTDDRPRVPDPEVSAGFPLDAAFRPTPGTLPALRYGRTYRLRARLADLAGNGPDAGTVTDDSTATAPLAYRRWEPVPPPAIVPRWPFLEGESEPRLVIRSTIQDDGTPVSATQWALLRNPQVPGHQAVTPVDGLDRRYRDFDERHLSPPKSPLRAAEQHGMFDTAFGPDKPEEVHRRFFAAASREAGSYLDTVVSLPENPDVTHDLKFFREIHVAKLDIHDPEPLTELPVPRGSGLKPGEYVVHDAPRLLLPYLPDVLARGISLRGLPGAAPNETFDFPGPWPQAEPLRLRIVEGDGPPEWQGPLERQLTVFLPKAETVTVRMSCRMDPADLQLLGQWRLLTDSPLWNDPATGLPQDKKDELAAAAAAGENWMLTPWAELTLVHAVEKPLLPPELGPLDFTRAEGQTFAGVSGVVHAHAKSTGRIDVDATWSEWTDDPAQPGPVRTPGHAHAGDLTLQPDEDQRVLFLRQEFRDTRHRDITYTPTATTRFREYFHPAITDQPALVTRVGPASPGASVRGWPVPSSRRPEPPVISHLVPTFRWERTADHDRHQVTHIRRTAGVRVHLRRPWFSSGDDELLAVVLDPGGGLPDELVSRRAPDPVWSPPPPLPPLTPDSFPGATLTATGRQLAEPVNGRPATVSVAAFTPVYDAQQRLWHCDIDIAADQGHNAAYFPYLRLALARYQPYSVDPLHLSKVVLADFIQPLPERTVTAAMNPDGSIALTLDGPMAFNSLGSGAGSGRRVAARVEILAAPGGDLDWQDTGAGTELTCVPAGSGFTWTGTLTPPAPPVSPLARYRLVVEEHEVYATDTETATATVTGPGGRPVPVAHRLVHADQFPLAVSLLGRIVVAEGAPPQGRGTAD
ncbi:hypothetical protein [Streptomyces orinoci]|uniref:Uncharacterized protein n=1 Tax=Streptomyces orinoci TaxID=67339 RepID=A0ABV3JZL8_STRON|nr:hypothetical protein [Streptomyces orinoci]